MGDEAKNNDVSSPAAGNAPPPSPRSAGGMDVMALCLLAGAMFLWSGTFIAMKAVLAHVHPVFMVFVRMAASSLLMLPFLRVWWRRTPYSAGDWRILALLVVSEPCLYFIFEAYALRYTTASQAGLITALLPLLVGVSAFFVLGERLAPRVWAGFFLAVCGVAVLTLAGENSESAPNAFFGNALEFMAMLMACVYTLCVRRLRGYPPFFITAAQALSGTFFFGLLLLLMDAPLPESLPPPQALFCLGFLAFSTIVAYGFYNMGIARFSAAQAASWLNLIPAITLFLGISLLGESLNFIQAVAVAPILVGVVLSQSARVRRR